MTEGAQNNVDKLYIQNKEQLGEYLWVDKILVPEMSEAFLVTKEEIARLKKELENLPQETQTEKIAVFIQQKADVQKTTLKKALDLKEAIGRGDINTATTTGVGIIASQIKDEIKKVSSEKKWLDKLETSMDVIENRLDKLLNGIEEAWEQILTGDTKGAKESFMSALGLDKKSLIDKAEKISPKEIKQEISKEAEKRNISIQEAADYKEKLLTWVKEKFHIEITPENKEKIQSILDKHIVSGDLVVDKLKEGTFTIGDIMFSSSIATIKFAYALQQAGILPLNSIMMGIGEGIVDTGASTVKLGFRAAEAVATDQNSDWILGEFSLEHLSKQTEQLSVDEKAFLLGLMYRQSWLVTSILGQGIYLLSKGALAAFETRDYVSSALLGKQSLLGQYNNMTESLQKIMVVLGEKDFSKFGALKTAFEETVGNSAILSVYRESGEDVAKFKQGLETIMKDPQLANTSIIKEAAESLARGELVEGKIGVSLANKIKTGEMLSQAKYVDAMTWMKQKLTQDAAFSASADAADDLARRLSRVNTGFQDVLRSGPEVVSMWNRFKSTFDIIKVPGQVERTAFNIKDTKTFQETIGYLSKQAPELLRGILGKMPIFIVAGVSITSENPAEEFGKSLLYMIPFIGPVFIATGAGVENWRPKKVEEFAMGTGLFMLDMYGISKIPRADWGKFMIRPFTDMAQVVKGTYQTMLWMKQGFSWVAEAVKMGKFSPELVPAFGRTAFRLGLIACMIYGATNLLNKNPAEAAEDLKKKGFFDEQGNLDMVKLQENFTSGAINKTEKETILRFLALSSINTPTADENVVVKDIKVSLGDDWIAKVDFMSIVSLPERETIIDAFNHLGVKVSFRYQDSAIKAYLAKAQTEGRQEQAKNTLEVLGISL